MDSSHANGFKGDDLYSQLNKCDHVQDIKRKDWAGILIKALDKISNLNSPMTIRFEKQMGMLRSRSSYCIPELPSVEPKLVTGFFINARNVEYLEGLLYSELQQMISKIELPSDLPVIYQYIHIRRGDFLLNHATYGLLGTNHYKKFIDKSLPLVIGTDDLASAQSVIGDLNPSFVFSPEDSTAWQALKMMASAESLVLANSTLSWWGGFLASNKGKTVYSPSPFYRDSDKNEDVLQYHKFSKVNSDFL
jgi:hypothetical protein